MRTFSHMSPLTPNVMDFSSSLHAIGTRTSRNSTLLCGWMMYFWLRSPYPSVEEFVIGGIETTIPLHQKIIQQPEFIDGEYNIHWLEKLVGLKK